MVDGQGPDAVLCTVCRLPADQHTGVRIGAFCGETEAGVLRAHITRLATMPGRREAIERIAQALVEEHNTIPWSARAESDRKLWRVRAAELLPPVPSPTRAHWDIRGFAAYLRRALDPLRSGTGPVIVDRLTVESVVTMLEDLAGVRTGPTSGTPRGADTVGVNDMATAIAATMREAGTLGGLSEDDVLRVVVAYLTLYAVRPVAVPMEEEVARLREVLVDGFRVSATAEYGDPSSHPVVKRKWERDVQSSTEDLDALIAAVLNAADVTRERLDALVRRLHFALNGECIAYPGSGEACDPMACDCLSIAQDWTAEEVVEEVVRRLATHARRSET